MSTYPEDPDGFILYDERPDPFDNRRVSRTRFCRSKPAYFAGHRCSVRTIAVDKPIMLGTMQPQPTGRRRSVCLAIAFTAYCTIKALGWKSGAMMPEKGIIRRYGCSESASYLPPSA